MDERVGQLQITPLLFVIAFSSAAWAIEGPARVVDGDTLTIGKERVRIQNFNAPELDQPGGPQVKARLEALTRGKTVHCDPRARDRYGRLVARCDVNGLDLGRAMRP